jgi:hypothetical protein
MRKMKKILDVAFALEEGGLQLPSAESFKVKDLVEMLRFAASSDKVIARHDDDHGLDSLSKNFLEAPVEAAGSRRFSEELGRVMECANVVVPLFTRELSEDDLDEIEEDRCYRGMPSQR